MLVLKMEINYDREADALYIKLYRGKIATNKKVDDLTILDLNKAKKILGIEILNASKRIPSKSLSEVSIRNIAIVPSK